MFNKFTKYQYKQTFVEYTLIAIMVALSLISATILLSNKITEVTGVIK
jgi:Flp pilus assembly pilin Flp